MDLGLTGRRALVAASSAGLGWATAAALHAEGAEVLINGRDPERLARAADALPGVSTVVGDVGTVEGARAVAAQAREQLGGVDICVVNAGGPPAGDFASTPLEAYGPALELSLLSAVAMISDLVPGMSERGWGRILAITSVSARQPIPQLILSNTARAGLTGFLKTLATEVAGKGITVNSIQPGTHDTARVRSVFGDDLSGLGSQVPVGRIGDAASFGRIAAFLCSEPAWYLTGVALPVDGGATLGLQ